MTGEKERNIFAVMGKEDFRIQNEHSVASEIKSRLFLRPGNIGRLIKDGRPPIRVPGGWGSLPSIDSGGRVARPRSRTVYWIPPPDMTTAEAIGTGKGIILHFTTPEKGGVPVYFLDEEVLKRGTSYLFNNTQIGKLHKRMEIASKKVRRQT